MVKAADDNDSDIRMDGRAEDDACFPPLSGPSDGYIQANEDKKSNARDKLENSISAVADRLAHLMEDCSFVLNTCTGKGGGECDDFFGGWLC